VTPIFYGYAQHIATRLCTTCPLSPTLRYPSVILPLAPFSPVMHAFVSLVLTALTPAMGSLYAQSPEWRTVPSPIAVLTLTHTSGLSSRFISSMKPFMTTLSKVLSPKFIPSASTCTTWYYCRLIPVITWYCLPLPLMTMFMVVYFCLLLFSLNTEKCLRLQHTTSNI
jgi:hypothetical protein